MSCEIIKSLDELNSEIQASLTELHNLVLVKENLEARQANKIQEIQNERHDLIAEQVNEENLGSRNEEVRRKFSVLDVIVKNDADKITEEMKSLTKILNVKTSIECNASANESFLELKVEFPDINHSYATFLYDPSTEDFECAYFLFQIFK